MLRLVTFQSKTCQTEVVSAGAIKLLVKMCDIFNPEGFHGNCCQPPYWSSSDAVQLLHDLTYRKKLVGQLKELNKDNIREKAVKLIKTGEEISCVFSQTRPFKHICVTQIESVGRTSFYGNCRSKYHVFYSTL